MAARPVESHGVGGVTGLEAWVLQRPRAPATFYTERKVYSP